MFLSKKNVLCRCRFELLFLSVIIIVKQNKKQLLRYFFLAFFSNYILIDSFNWDILPFSSGALLYFSNLFTAIASNRTLAAGYSFKTSHMSFLLNTNKSL